MAGGRWVMMARPKKGIPREKGKFIDVTPGLFESFVEAFKEPIPVQVSHMPGGLIGQLLGAKEQAPGWVDNVKVEDGNLYGYVRAGEGLKAAVARRELPNRSISFAVSEFQTEEGGEARKGSPLKGRLLHLALLGVTAPAIDGMPPILALSEDAADGVISLDAEPLDTEFPEGYGEGLGSAPQGPSEDDTVKDEKIRELQAKIDSLELAKRVDQWTALPPFLLNEAKGLVEKLSSEHREEVLVFADKVNAYLKAEFRSPERGPADASAPTLAERIEAHAKTKGVTSLEAYEDLLKQNLIPAIQPGSN